MDILRAVPGINFGPDAVTWQSLVTSFSTACESFEHNGEFLSMSAVTLLASEFGNLLNLADADMVNLFITLWDGRQRYEKQTKMSGNDIIDAPWINILACTTPSWISTNMNQLATAGGLTSRTIYVFADAKENFIAYLDEHAPANVEQMKLDLIHDLEYISMNLSGPFHITKDARDWGNEWYTNLWKNHYSPDKPDWTKGFIARKQTHLHKMAMILSVSRDDKMMITAEDLQLSEEMLRSVESNLDRVFAHVGRSDESIQAERFIDFIKKAGELEYANAYKSIHTFFPDFRDFEGIVSGAVRSGQIRMVQKGNDFWLVYSGGRV